MERVYHIMTDTHVYLDMDTDLRQLLFLSNLVEKDRDKRRIAKP